MLHNLTTQKDIKTFSISPENFTGEKGQGGKTLVEKGTASFAASELGIGWKVNPYLYAQPNSTLVLADVKGQGAIKHIWIVDSAEYGRQLILKIYFDGQKNPSVRVPLSDFFANADYNDFRKISSLPICVNPKKGMNCYFEMPYRKGFRIEIENIGEKKAMVYYQIDCEEKKIPENSLYFHALFNRVKKLPYKTTYPILSGIKGNGHYVGTYMHWGVTSSGWWGEGEIKFYIDGDGEYPTVCGTGTEDYFCGAWNFDVDGKYVEYCTPYSGLSKVSKPDEIYKPGSYFDMYRFHITDPIYFKENLRITIQALGWNKDYKYLPFEDDISSVAYWYSDNLNDEYPEMQTAQELKLT